MDLTAPGNVTSLLGRVKPEDLDRPIADVLGMPLDEVGWGTVWQWRALAAPFSEEDIEHKPQQILSRQNDPDQEAGPCRSGAQVNTKWGTKPVSQDGFHCGNRHGWAVHLPYVGHAGLTTRLNDVCTPAGWSWEPVARDSNGLPLIQGGMMWIRLTILGVTKEGVGDAESRSGPQATKEIIGDALRNAAMRFGLATYLWGKSDKARALAGVGEPEPRQEPERQGRPRQISQRAQQVEAAPQPPKDDDAPESRLIAAQHRAAAMSVRAFPKRDEETAEQRIEWLRTVLAERGLPDTVPGWLQLARDYEFTARSLGAGEGGSSDDGAPI